MKTVGILARYAICAPFDLLAFIAGALFYALWGADKRWYKGAWVITAKKNSWFDKHPYSMTWGHVIVLDPDHAHMLDVLEHECVHIEQYEAAMLHGLLAALCLGYWLPWLATVVLWGSAGWLRYVSASGVALLRGEDAYRGNHLEEAAYALDGERAAEARRKKKR